LQGSKVPPALIAVASKDDGVAFKVSSDSFSPPVACPAIDRVVTFVSAGDKSPAAVATIPAGVTNAILLFLDSGSDKAANPWRVFVIDDSSKKIPDGGAFVANFYNHDIRFIIGENKITLKPGGTTSVKMPEQRNGFNMAEVLFQFQQGKDWVTPTQTMMQFAPGMRYLFFAFVDRLGQPRMSPYQDTFQPPPLQKP
jgi:hypothetical protein